MLDSVSSNAVDIAQTLECGAFSDETKQIIADEGLLPEGLVNRLHRQYTSVSALGSTDKPLFTERNDYTGLGGFRAVNQILLDNGIDIGHQDERELFVEVYRFLATKHTLNSINWNDFATDSIFQLVFPQPSMINKKVTDAYVTAPEGEARTAIAQEYMKETNPHDGNQQLNKPWFVNSEGVLELLAGSQHKYPQCQLIFDKSTQHCFSFCTYCFRHAQVRGDEDMFLQNDVDQAHAYLRLHTEVSDLLITGGDGGFMPANRLKQYCDPIMHDPSLQHIRTVRLATRALTFHPEMMLTKKYDAMLAVFDELHDNGVQLALMAHFSTPRELLNPVTIAAIRRLQKHGVVVRSQSPIMRHISMFDNEDGTIDIDRSAQNWIDLGNIFATLKVGFHSMYCARPTGEHHYFTAPLADVAKIFDKIYRSLSSINRPSRYISMTTSAGKLSLLGTSEINGETTFALKFCESRNMQWMDKVFHAKYDEKTNNVSLLNPIEGNSFFFEDELAQIEEELASDLKAAMNSSKGVHMDEVSVEYDELGLDSHSVA
jgi:lysine 2,3-aminomutase